MPDTETAASARDQLQTSRAGRKIDLYLKLPLVWTRCYLQLNLIQTDSSAGPLCRAVQVEVHWTEAPRWLKGKWEPKPSLPSPPLNSAVLTGRLTEQRPRRKWKFCLDSRAAFSKLSSAYLWRQ